MFLVWIIALPRRNGLRGFLINHEEQSDAEHEHDEAHDLHGKTLIGQALTISSGV